MTKVSFIQYLLRGYLLMIMFWVPIFLCISQTLLLIVLDPEMVSSGEVSTSELILFIIILILPIVLVVLAYTLYKSFDIKYLRIITLFSVWFLFSTLVLFLVAASLGGTSQAVVEGVAGSTASRYYGYMKSAFGLTAVISPIIFGIAAFGNHLIKKKEMEIQ